MSQSRSAITQTSNEYARREFVRAGIHTNVNINDPGHGGLSTSVHTLPRWLHDAGYATAHIGKWHLGMGAQRPNAHGFDRFLRFHTWTIGYHDHRTSEGEPG